MVTSQCIRLSPGTRHQARVRLAPVGQARAPGRQAACEASRARTPDAWHRGRHRGEEEGARRAACYIPPRLPRVPSNRHLAERDPDAAAQPILKWRREATAAAGAAAVLPARVRAYAEPFLGLAPCSSTCTAGACSMATASRSPTRIPTSSVLPRGPTAAGGGGAAARHVGARVRGARGRVLLRGAGHGVQPGAAADRANMDADAVARAYTPELAATLIFLNRTGFNGLFRLNRRGAFNVPAGRYARPAFCDPAALRASGRGAGAARAVADHGVLRADSRRGRGGRLPVPRSALCPLSTTARFTAYTTGGFTEHDQQCCSGLWSTPRGAGARSC